MSDDIITRRKAALAKREARLREAGGEPKGDPEVRRARKLLKRAQRSAAKARGQAERVRARAPKAAPEEPEAASS